LANAEYRFRSFDEQISFSFAGQYCPTFRKANAQIVRTYLWLKQLDYVVILERQVKERGDIFMLITTFLVDAPGKHANLESRYQRRKK